MNVLTGSKFQEPPLPIAPFQPQPTMPVQYQPVHTHAHPVPHPTGMYQTQGVGHSVVTTDPNINFSSRAINMIPNPTATVSDNTHQNIYTVDNTVVRLDSNANVKTPLGDTVKKFMETPQAQAELQRQISSENVDSSQYPAIASLHLVLRRNLFPLPTR